MINITNWGNIMEIGERYLITSVNRKTYFSESIYEKDEIKLKRVQGWNSAEWLITISDDDELEALTAQLKEDASEKLSFWDFEEVEIQAEDDGWYEEWELLQGDFDLEKHQKDFEEKSENQEDFEHGDFLEYIENELVFESNDGDSYFTGQISVEESF